MEKQEARRAYPRFQCDVPVLVLGGKPLKFSYTSMRNFSLGGMYFELSDPLEAGDFIVVRTDDKVVVDLIISGTWKQRLMKVKWCTGLEAGDEERYGCGVQYAGAE